MLNVKGIQTRSPNTSMKPNLSAIMSHLQEINHALIFSLTAQNHKCNEMYNEHDSCADKN